MKIRTIIVVASLFIGIACALADDIEKGEPAAPPNAKAVVGSYYSGDGLGYNIALTLKEDGSYSAEWHGCLGKYGDASGTWRLSDKRIVLTPKKETDMMKDHLKNLDVLKYKGGWIFVRADHRDFYDKHGVSRYSCFQKRDQK
jgi:hypothetical protein